VEVILRRAEVILKVEARSQKSAAGLRKRRESAATTRTQDEEPLSGDDFDFRETGSFQRRRQDPRARRKPSATRKLAPSSSRRTWTSSTAVDGPGARLRVLARVDEGEQPAGNEPPSNPAPKELVQADRDTTWLIQKPANRPST